MSEKKAYILCSFAKKSQIYTSWMARASLPCVVVDDFAPKWRVPDDAGIIISHMHYRWEEIAALRKIYETSNIPVLILADGILEYRNIWEHPELADGCIFQPIVGHKLATIGYGQTRAIESWGNVGKCETIGLPRLDSARDNVPPIRTEGPFRILVATATTPAFDEVQRKAVVESLLSLHKRLTTKPSVNGRAVDVIWRLTDGLGEAIGVEMEPSDQERPSLTSVIENVDAVITTPSTIFLECALKNRPVATLDFHNTPHFVGSAWMINSPAHLNQTLRELADPPAAKMMFQENVLHDQLRCVGSAADRMVTLIDEMVAEGIAARDQGRDIEMPPRIIGDKLLGFSPVVSRYDLGQQYPENEVFQNQDLERLHLELNLAVKRLDTAPGEVVQIREQMDEMLKEHREAKDDFSSRQGKLQNRVDELKNMRSEIKARYDKLIERYDNLLSERKQMQTQIKNLTQQLNQGERPSGQGPSGNA